MDAIRIAVSDSALAWLDTPYIYHQEARGLGADCCTFINGIMGDAGVFHDDTLHTLQYGPDGSNPGNHELYVEHLLKFCREIDRSQLDVGDIVVARITEGLYNHGAVVIAPGLPNLIHCTFRGVERTTMRDPMFFCKDKRYFSPWGRE